MRYVILLAMIEIGCGGSSDGLGVDMSRTQYDFGEAPPGSDFGGSVDQAQPPELAIQYAVTTPYHLSGSSPAGSDGFVYSVLPCSPLACDPWNLTFCYQSICLTLSEPLQGLPSGETVMAIPANGMLTATGSVSCSSWKSTGTISWYDATPLHWHIGIDVQCTDNSVAFVGDWKRVD